ncbi:MAG: integrase [Acidovorax sp.]|uniref:integrase n=1 Tax=Acidovorax sp. TaxID=1872122 RepID=UPI0039194B9E
MAALSPEACDYVRQLARRLGDAEHGNGTAMVRDAGDFLGLSVQTVYRHLKAVAGWSSGRKARSDKGSTSVSTEVLVTLGAAQREAVRENDKQTLFTTTARGLLEQNGYAFGVTNGHLNRLMRDRKLNVAAQRVAAPVQALRAPFPNHTHQVDPSLCLVYYLKGRQYIIRDDEFYKNKLDKIAQLKFKVYRYVCYDRASASLIPWYCEAAGENQHNLFRFLMFAWGLQGGRPVHGVPYHLLWDKGSANQSEAIKSLLDALGVKHLTHEAGNSRAKGGVENGNNIVETQFESRLKFEPVDSVEQLNAAAFSWANAYNANLIPGQDTRLRRPGLVAPVARFDLWQLITSGQLRVLPPLEVCQAFMRSKEEERKVGGDQSFTFRHPAAGRTMAYSLRGFDGINVGDTVLVRGLVYGDCAVQVQVPRYDGEMLTYRVEPVQGFDQFGQLEAAAEIGAEYKSAPRTEAEQAAATMDGAAFPGLSADEVKKARQKRATPFEGKLKAHSYLHDVELPTYLPRAGTEIATPQSATAAPSMLEATDAMLRIVAATKQRLTPDQNAFFMQRYADGVPEDQIDALIAQFTAPAADQPMRAAGGLRSV